MNQEYKVNDVFIEQYKNNKRFIFVEAVNSYKHYYVPETSYEVFVYDIFNYGGAYSQSVYSETKLNSFKLLGNVNKDNFFDFCINYLESEKIFI